MPLSHEGFKTLPVKAILRQLRPKQLWFLCQISERAKDASDHETKWGAPEMAPPSVPDCYYRSEKI